MSPPPAGQTQDAGQPKKKEGKVATCRYCEMTFRKLEHAQRHERTHTNDRPYTCDKCGKTFARQDTLHRHGRLHLRDNDDGPTAKGGRKRRASNASAAAKPPTPPKTGSDSSSSSSGRAGSSQPEFDFESFAASIEGPGPANLARKMSSNIPTTLEELLSNTANDLSAPVPIAVTAEEKAKAAQQQSQADVERYPTPPSGTLSSSALALHPEPSQSFEASASYDLAAHINSIISSADADQQARDRAATAAMYSSGFGVSPGAQVGLNYGLPTPMPTYAQPAPAPATSQAEQPATATTSSLSLPVLSNPLGAGSPASIPRDSSFFAAALSATYATTYPSLSLPVAGFDLPNSTSLKSNTPATFDLKAAMGGLASPLSMSAPADSSSSVPHSHFDRLAKAWEQRQRAAALLSAQEGGAPKQPQINLRSPFAHPAKSTPAFYIPASGGPASPPSSASSSTSASAGDSRASAALAALSTPSQSLW